jgi:hypothetical protein
MEVCDVLNDKVMGYSASRKAWGMMPVRFVGNAGYAARRWGVNDASPVGEVAGSIDYLRMLPDLLGLGCYLVQDDHTRTKLSKADHYRDENGNAVKLDGTQGQYMWGWKTKWYYSFWTEGGYYYEAASLSPIPGHLNYEIPVASTSALGVGVMDRTNSMLVSVISDAAQYRGGNNDSSKDGAYNTLLGRAATNQTHNAYETAALKHGEGWSAFWYGHWNITGALFRIIFGTRNVQAAFTADKDSNGLYQGGFGPGVTQFGTYWNSKFGNYPFLPTSVGVELGDGCGVVDYQVTDDEGTDLGTVQVPVMFGLKNFYGYLWRLTGGILVSWDENTVGHIYVNRHYYKQNNSPNTTEGLIEVGLASTAAGEWMVKELSMDHLCGIPTASGASDATYYCDKCWNYPAASALRRPALGAHADYGGMAGLAAVNLNHGVSNAGANHGAPLCEAASDWDTEPFMAD